MVDLSDSLRCFGRISIGWIALLGHCHKGHWGDRNLNQHIQAFVSTNSDRDERNPSAMIWMSCDAVAKWIYQTLRHGQETGEVARFLQQGQDGQLFLMSHSQALQLVSHRLLSQAVYPVLHWLLQETIEPVLSEWWFGVYRATALAYRHVRTALDDSHGNSRPCLDSISRFGARHSCVVLQIDVESP